MQKQEIQNVTVNQDSTSEKENLSITIPLEGYPLLQHMEDLQEQHNILKLKIKNLEKKTSGNKAVTPAGLRKKEELKILEEQQKQIQSKFNFLAPYVQEYAKKQYGDVDCKIIISHYCDINKVRGKLQKDIEKHIDCTARNFRVKLQNCWLKSLVKKT